MNKATDFEYEDVQGLLRFGYGKLTETCFMLLDIADVAAAQKWLTTVPINHAVTTDQSPETAVQIAFSARGLRALGLRKSLLEGFSDEFLTGMSGDESRSRRLGDIGRNAPEYWQWGGNPEELPDVLLLIYALKGNLEGQLERWRKTVEGANFAKAFRIRSVLPTNTMGDNEPFGFADGISQPVIDWERRQSTDLHVRDRYSNLLALGEVVLGYPNEYGLYTTRPLIDPRDDPPAAILPDAEDHPALKDFGRNGTYLVIRQLHQDVPGFWQFLDQAAGSDPQQRERLAEAMVGRKRDGTPLVPRTGETIPGIPADADNNHFTYEPDAKGFRCPIGAHIRRANPRTGDFPSAITGLLSRLIKLLGFNQQGTDEDLIASTRFHRLLRRGRGYGPVLPPEAAVKPGAPADDRGLQFIVLGASISRQFEFVQNAWIMSSKFGGVQRQRDPLLGTRQPLDNGDVTDTFNRSNAQGPMQTTCALPQFIDVVGGGYFFMPGLRALRYLATNPNPGNEDES